ncbi:MAG: penicillin-binding protein 1C [Pseudooceanicola nanhaiensis]
MSRRAGLALGVLALVLGLAAGGRDAADRWIAATDLPPLVPETGAEVRDRAGRTLRVYTVGDGLWRLAVRGAEVDPLYPAMLVAYEDKRFARHGGVDPLAVLRAGWQALRHGEVRSGASTLTMQVARLLEDGATGTWRGKLRQMRVALALERRLDKAGILSLYLHLAPFGGNLEGVRAATLSWFGKEPGRLTPAEAALLVALPQSPEARRPDLSPGAARAARDRVLARAAASGVLTAQDAAAARRDPVPVARRPMPQHAPHLADRALAAAPETRVHVLTVDAGIQARLERLAADAVRDAAPGVSVAMVAADLQSGEILASVGSGAYAPGGRQGFVDMTRAVRSPGSLLKPLVYALAFDAGLAHPETLIADRPVAFGGYAPQNFDGAFRGEVRVRRALQLSLNVPVVLLTDALGPERLMAALARAGLAAELPGGRPGLAVALGGVGVNLEDMVALYAGLAAGGETRALRWRLGRDGATAAPRRIVSRAAAWQVGHVLAGLAPPPGAPLDRLAYKTGTSYGHRDAWAIGFDGRHVVGVWMGRPDGTPVPGVFGADAAAPLLFDAFQRLKPVFDPLPPPPAEALVLGGSDLPAPLRRFRGRSAALIPDADAPALAFPPDGAVLEMGAGGVPVRVRDGTPPFTWLVSGAPALTGTRARHALLDGLERGFSEITVIDAEGRAARARIELE